MQTTDFWTAIRYWALSGPGGRALVLGCVFLVGVVAMLLSTN